VRSKRSASDSGDGPSGGIKLWLIDALYTRISSLRFQALHEQRMDDAAMEMSNLTLSPEQQMQMPHTPGGTKGGESTRSMIYNKLSPLSSSKKKERMGAVVI
jgi:hypothetical protein